MAQKVLNEEIKKIVKQVRRNHITDDQAVTLIMVEFNEAARAKEQDAAVQAEVIADAYAAVAADPNASPAATLPKEPSENGV